MVRALMWAYLSSGSAAGWGILGLVAIAAAGRLTVGGVAMGLRRRRAGGALAILEARLARGEITREEFADLSAVIRGR